MTQVTYTEVVTTEQIEAVNYNAHHGYGNGQEKVLVAEKVAKALEQVGAEVVKNGERLHVFEGVMSAEQYKKRYKWLIENLEVDPESYDSCCTVENEHKAKLLREHFGVESPKKYDGRYESGLYVSVGLCDEEGNVLPRPNMLEESVTSWGMTEFNTDEEYAYVSRLKIYMEKEGFVQVSKERWYEFKYEGA